MKLNVYVLTYNRSTLLKETIESILQQTYQDFDLYILDNCSMDDTGSVVQAFGDSRIHHIKHEKNIGGEGNLNFGLNHNQSDFFVLFHDDDLMLPDFLQKELEVMESDPSIVAVGGNAEQFGAITNPALFDLKENLYLKGEEYIRRYLRTGATLVFPSVMYRNTFIQAHQIRIKHEPDPCGDIVLLADIGRNGGTICQISDIIMKYRMHENQDSSRNYFSMHIKLFNYLRTNENYREIYAAGKDYYPAKYQDWSKRLFSKWLYGDISNEEAEKTFQGLASCLMVEDEGIWRRLFRECSKHPFIKKTFLWVYTARRKAIEH